jgi:hypothetical protein
MKNKIFAIFGTVALLALLWVASGVVAGPPAEGPEGEGEVTIASTVSSRISYQGVLKENGQPVTGNRDMTFRLYSDDTCSTQVGSDIVKSDVQVTNGLFSVDLDVTHGHFNGQGLWLKVFVDGTGLGCEEILPVPYALSLRPGAEIAGSIDGDSVLEARNESSADGSTGVYGYATATSGYTYGVYGRSYSTDYGKGVFGTAPKYGVYGWASADSGYTFGVIGESDSTDYGKGVFGTAPKYGVYGSASADSGYTYGVYGYSRSTSGTGVYGYATADSGTTYGVYGQSDSTSGRGVYGVAITTTGTTYGVYGYARSPDGYGGYFVNTSSGGVGLYAKGTDWAGYFEGDVRADKLVYSSPRTHYFVVGGEGFVPGSNVDYQNTYLMGGAYIYTGSGALVAPVHLPHGAVVTELKVFFNDTSTSNMTVYLARLNLSSGGYVFMAAVDSSGISGYGSKTDTTISYATIDNTAYGYHIHAWSDSWDSNLKIMGALVVYTISESP